MAWLSRDEIFALGFVEVGEDVRISDRASIYVTKGSCIGDRSRIDDFCVVSGKVDIGKNVHVAVFSNVAGGEPGVVMEDFAGLAYGCHVFTHSDDYSGGSLTNPTVPAKYKKEKKAEVRLGRHVILGTCAIVLPGVLVAEGCSVGAHALVTLSTEPWGIYVGAPAKRLKDRRRDLLKLEAHYVKDLGSKTIG